VVVVHPSSTNLTHQGEFIISRQVHEVLVWFDVNNRALYDIVTSNGIPTFDIIMTHLYSIKRKIINLKSLLSHIKMSIKHSIDELERIKVEIARNNAQNRDLRKRARVLESQISDYLQSKSQAGVKYKGRAIILETTERRCRKTKSDKNRDVVAFLTELGVADPQQVYLELLNVQKGDATEHHKLTFKKIKGR
jgi:hypothetical protein